MLRVSNELQALHGSRPVPGGHAVCRLIESKFIFFASLSRSYDYYSRQPNARLDEAQARFIIAECVLALEYIHRCPMICFRATSSTHGPAARAMSIVISSRRMCCSPPTVTARWCVPPLAFVHPQSPMLFRFVFRSRSHVVPG